MENIKITPKKILIQTSVDADFQTVVSNFNRNLFEALKPPLMPLKLLRYDGQETGDQVHLDLGFGQRWISLISDHGQTESEWFFVDEGQVLPKPLRHWKHIHKIIKQTESKTLIIDDISFSSGSSLLDLLLYPFLYFQFALRKPAYKKYFGKM